MEIAPLTKDRLEEMYKLVKKVFPYEKDESIINPIEGSLGINPEKNWKWLKEKECNSVKYFVLIENEKIVGTTGIYTNESDKDSASWLAWFCISYEKREKGLGSKLLEFSIDKAKKENKKFMRLYTSDHPNEVAANRLYDKRGFKLIKKESDDNLPGINILYKELTL